MLNENTLIEITARLYDLTYDGVIEWTHTNGNFKTNFIDDNYLITDLSTLRINDTCVSSVENVSNSVKNLRNDLLEFYVGTPIVNKLEYACVLTDNLMEGLNNLLLDLETSTYDEDLNYMD